MVLHHLDRLDILVRDILGRQPVLSADKVIAVDIESVYRFALILDSAVLLDLDSGQTLYHVDYGIVTYLGKAVYAEHQRVPLGIDVGSLDYHLVELGCLPGQGYGFRDAVCA